jgi:hypothetical protein
MKMNVVAQDCDVRRAVMKLVGFERGFHAEEKCFVMFINLYV